MLEQEIHKSPLVDILSKIIKSQVVMSGNNYVRLDNKEIVESNHIEEAMLEQENLFIIATNLQLKKTIVNELSELQVTIESGKTFYVDPDSRVDITIVVDELLEEGLTETEWKLAKEFEGERIVMVTLDEFKEARKLSLLAKGKLVGVIK